jgi:hypothetical protein
MVYFKTKNWVHFGGSCNGRCWWAFWTFGLFYGHLVYFTAIWSILRPFDIFYGHLVYFTAIWSILRPFGLFYGHLVYFTAIWSILRPFDIFYGHLAYYVAKFPHILVYCNKKSGNPDVNHPRSILRVMLCAVKQGCQMVYFHTKNTKLRTFWRALQWKMLVNVIAIWCI